VRRLRYTAAFIVWPWSTREFGRSLLGIEKPGFTTGLPTGDVDPEALPQASFAFCSVN
jgi:hypothetical protein